jgi:hypothetical protein
MPFNTTCSPRASEAQGLSAELYRFTRGQIEYTEMQKNFGQSWCDLGLKGAEHETAVHRRAFAPEICGRALCITVHTFPLEDDMFFNSYPRKLRPNQSAVYTFALTVNIAT